jgi:hypothetical protein
MVSGLAAKAITAFEGPESVTAPPPQLARKVRTKTKDNFRKLLRTIDEVFDRTMALSHPGVMAEM